MEPQPSPAPRAREIPLSRSGNSGWQPAGGIIDRMLAYRDWWNIPEGKGRASHARDRARGRSRRDREAAA